MTPCKINEKPTLRFVKTEQRALVTVAGLIHALSYYDESLAEVSDKVRSIVAKLDENGVYAP